MKGLFNFIHLQYTYHIPPVSIQNAIDQIGQSYYYAYHSFGLHIMGYLNIQEKGDEFETVLVLEEYESQSDADEGLHINVEYAIDLNENNKGLYYFIKDTLLKKEIQFNSIHITIDVDGYCCADYELDGEIVNLE